ncbi:hypothetical protein, partial [Nostoc sp. UCD121]|uniref:hypothetical protein n=1 Tax=Nostoc sp. UCD121 TaxID=2681305 RepID=UPI001C8AE466
AGRGQREMRKILAFSVCLKAQLPSKKVQLPNSKAQLSSSEVVIKIKLTLIALSLSPSFLPSPPLLIFKTEG